MDTFWKAVEDKEWNNKTESTLVLKINKYGTYFLVENVIRGVKFDSTLAYECLLDKLDLWEKLPEADIGNEKYFMEEIKKCKYREVTRLLEKLSKIISKIRITSPEDNICFLITLQNTCTNIINSDK